MRKISILLSTLVLAAMVLAACGGEETATNLPSTEVPQITAEATDDVTGTATEPSTGEATGTPGIPVTGELNPARVTNELDFTVWNQDGEQIGEVNDMVLDLDNTRVAYVVVGTGGFLDLGEREILVPWNCLQLQTGTGDTTGGQQNAFILQTDMDMFRNAPDFDLNANLPQMGQPADDWDADIRDWCAGGGTTTSNTPSAQETATPGAGTGTGQGTATATSGTGTTSQATATVGTGTGQATVTPGTGTGQGTATATAGTGTGQGTGQGTTTLQGVVLASEVLGSTVTLGTQSQRTGTGQATATPGTGTGTGPGTATPTSSSGTGGGTATATAGTGTSTSTDQGTATPGSTVEGTATTTTGTGGTGTGTGQGVTNATIEDMMIDTDSGDILYIVLNGAFTEGERLIPVPLGVFQWNSGTQEISLNADSTMFQSAPFFQDGQFPDMTTSGWNSEFDTFWQNNGVGGGSGGVAATATP